MSDDLRTWLMSRYATNREIARLCDAAFGVERRPKIGIDRGKKGGDAAAFTIVDEAQMLAHWVGPPGKELSDEEMFQRIEKEIEKMENEATEVQLAASKYQRIAHLEDFHSAFPEFSTLAKGQKVRIVEVADDSGEKTGSVIARTVAEKSQAPEGVDPIVGFVKG